MAGRRVPAITSRPRRGPRDLSGVSPAGVRHRWISGGASTGPAPRDGRGSIDWQAALLGRAAPRPPPLGPAGTVPPLVSDEQAGFDIQDEFARFDQKNDAFSRSWWDESYQKTCGGKDRVMSFYNRCESAKTLASIDINRPRIGLEWLRTGLN